MERKTIRVCATSDLHGHLPDIPPCDVLILAGDLCPSSNHKSMFQSIWMRGPFKDWLEKTYEESGCYEIIGICGNHDFLGLDYPDILYDLPWNYLCDEAYISHGLRVWGCPHTKTFFEWAFMMDPEELAKHHIAIPQDTDIVVTHGMPYGFGDGVTRRKMVNRKPNEWLDHTGSPALTDWIVANQPKLVVGGHIHCSQSTRRLGETVIANVSYVNEKYQPCYPPQIFDIEGDSCRAISSLNRVVLGMDLPGDSKI
jgi:Icc-related predicted phosphoesterase